MALPEFIPGIRRHQSQELKEKLRRLVAHENKLHVLEGNMVVEIKRTGYDKGIASIKIISNRKFDFIIAMGDDKPMKMCTGRLPPEADYHQNSA